MCRESLERSLNFRVEMVGCVRDGGVPRIDPEVEDARGKQDERDRPGQHKRKKLAGQSRSGLPQARAMNGEPLNENITGHKSARAREQERKPRGAPPLAQSIAKPGKTRSKRPVSCNR